MGAKSGSTTQVNNNAPWMGLDPFLAGAPGSIMGPNGQMGGNSLYTQAGEIGNTPLQFPNFQTYAGPTDQQNQAIAAQTNLAQHDPITQASMSGLQPYLNGSMLQAGNPYLSNVVGQLGQAIAPSIDSHFNMNGRAGSGANNQAFASALANQAGQMAYQNYSDQSTNQLKAILEGGQVSSNAFNDIAALSQAGAQQQSFNQLPITQQLQQFSFAQDAPFIQASRMQALLGNQPTSSTQTNPYFTNPVGSAIGTLGGTFGAANSGMQLYNSLFGSAAPAAGSASVGSSMAANGLFSSFNPAGVAETFGGY